MLGSLGGTEVFGWKSFLPWHENLRYKGHFGEQNSIFYGIITCLGILVLKNQGAASSLYKVYIYIYRLFSIRFHDSLSLVIPNNKTTEHWRLKMLYYCNVVMNLDELEHSK